MRLDPDALPTAVQRLARSTVIGALADSAHRLSATGRGPALSLVRSLFDDAAAVLEVLTPVEGQDFPGYRVARTTIRRGLDAIDAASGMHSTGHVSSDDVAQHLRAAERRWRAVVAELVRLQPWAARFSSAPEQSQGRHLVEP
jgi:hypothetical protein